MKFLQINPADNVIVALKDLKAGETINLDDNTIELLSDIPMGHKIALDNIDTKSNVIKYGYPIGHAVSDIAKGDWVNENNIKTNLDGLLDYEYQPHSVDLDIAYQNRTFKGYKRANGTVGVRNEIWIIPTVGCVNGTIQSLAEELRAKTQLQGVDAIVAYPHNFGCSQLGDDHENTRKILRDMVLHPNAGGVLVVEIGRAHV